MESIEDYLAVGGYRALAKALSNMTPEQVLEEVRKANLRGRGGGGFPTGRKWETTKNAPGEPKYVIVNCDEGDPGAYMDRALMEGNPHSVLEGLVIGAYAIGSQQGFIYVRVNPEVAFARIKKRNRHAEKGITLSYLRQVHEKHEAHNQITSLDSTISLNPSKAALKI